MKVINSILTAVIMSLVIGCGGSGSGDKKDQENKSKYAGIWYASTIDRYLEIKNDDEVYFRKCSVNDGYKIDPLVSALIFEDEIVEDYFGREIVSELSLSSNSQTLTFGGDREGLSFEKKSALPSICTNNAIDITYYSPMEAFDQESTTFVVNFDYRWTKSVDGRARIGHTFNEEGHFSLTEEEHQISSIGVGSGSIEITITPEFFENGTPFILYATLTDYSSPNLVAVDPVVVEIISSGNSAAVLAESELGNPTAYKAEDIR